MEFLRKLLGEVSALRRDVDAIRKGLIRTGTVATVSHNLLVIDYPGTDADGNPRQSPEMPWFQPSTEHRPPGVGDHAMVIDPSLGRGQGVALVGWPSVARPGPTNGDNNIVFMEDLSTGALDMYGDDSRLIQVPAIEVVSPDISLGEAPTDYAARATGANSVDLFITTLDTAWRAWVPAPMDGGAALKAALTAAFAAPPQSTAATQVKVK